MIRRLRCRGRRIWIRHGSRYGRDYRVHGWVVGWRCPFDFGRLKELNTTSDETTAACSPDSGFSALGRCCMSVIPGSHLELLDHDETYEQDNLLTRGQELSIDVSARTTVAMPLEPGEASFHNVRAAHGSGSNTTDDRRIGLSMHYMPTHTRQQLAEWDSAALVRGVDEFGHFEHAPRPRHENRFLDDPPLSPPAESSRDANTK